MVTRSEFKYVRISPTKVRSVINLVRGKNVQQAIDTLAICSRSASPVVSKLIKSAVANAHHKGGIDVDNLYISQIVVGQGPTLKRWRAKARGMAGRVSRMTSHITLELAEK